MKGPRPEQLVVVVGTGTDVGKTWVSSSFLKGCIALGMTVAARKPAQSFEPGTGPTDADVLSSATGEDAEKICPPHRWYEVAYAPPMAAVALGLPEFSNDDLFEEITWPFPRVSVGLVELAGGVSSPIASRGDPTDLIRMLSPDYLVLVADAGLGTINAVRTSLLALANGSTGGGSPGLEGNVVVVLNRFDPACELHQLNAAWLHMKDNVHLVACGHDNEVGCSFGLIGCLFGPEFLPEDIRSDMESDDVEDHSDTSPWFRHTAW
jgi:dethiobiotin synthetase